jgi:hypothetical protein
MARVTGFGTGAINELKAELVEGYYRRYSGPIKAVMRQEAPIDTGLLRASHSADPPRRVSTGWVIRFRAEVFYAVFQHEGHGGIRPVRAKALRWVTKLGRVVFAQYVRPQPANPWMYRAFTRIGFSRVRRINPRL